MGVRDTQQIVAHHAVDLPKHSVRELRVIIGGAYMLTAVARDDLSRKAALIF